MHKTTVIGIALLVFGATACTVQTNPTDLGERSARADVDKAALFGGQEEIIKPISLYEAIARAVKYNSQQRVDAMEQALQMGISDSATMDMLPQIAMSGGFTARNKQLAISAENAKTGLESLPESYVADKNERNADLQVVFNVLDFGISYVNAKQASDRRFIAEEMRRKSIQRIVYDVRIAFWKAAAAQRVADDMSALTSALQQELIRVNVGGAPKDKTIDQLAEQKQLLTALQTLTNLKKEVLTAKAELAALMNLPPNIEFEIDIPKAMDAPRIVKDFGQIDLEHFALVNRPELRIGDYEARIATQNAKKELLRIFPGIEFSAGVNYNSNSYLKNKGWVDAGMGITWNLMNLFTRPEAIKLAKGKEELEQARRVAMTMAVISQVNITYLQLRQSAEAFDVLDSLETVTDHMWQKTYAEKTNTVAERRAAVLTAVDLLVAHLKRDMAYAQYKSAESELFVALGVDPLPRFSMTAAVTTIAEVLENNLSRNAPRGFKEVSYDYPPSDKARLTVLSGEQRARILEWTNLRRTDAPLTARNTNNPVQLNGAVDAKSAPVKPVRVVKKAVKKPVIMSEPKLLQLSSFETLTSAQDYWGELTGKDPALAFYAPIFREVTLNDKPRFRTYIADTEAKLKDLCARLAAELKSCLIIKK